MFIKWVLGVLFSLLIGYCAGTSYVLVEEYRILVHWWIIIVLIGIGIGLAGVIGYCFLIKPRLVVIARRTAACKLREDQLERDRAAFEAYMKERMRSVIASGTKLMIELTEHEKASALGRQLRQVEAKLHGLYEEKMEKLQADNNRLRNDNHRLRLALEELIQKNRKYGYAAAKPAKNMKKLGLKEGPPIKREDL